MVPAISIDTSTGNITAEIIRENNLTYFVKVENKDGHKYFKIRKDDSRIVNE